MGQLTTHVLDTTAGVPANGVRIDVHQLPPFGAPALLVSVITGRDGRCPGPLLAGDAFRAGRYSLTFHLGDYFRARGAILPQPAFIEDTVVHIGVAHSDEHYHVPLLASPWSYSVYRGG
jgi:5-hydroxyisourate hydrolase